MSVLDECEMLVDELRDDDGFKHALTELRDAITEAVTDTDLRGVSSRYRDVAERLVEVVEMLEAQR